MRTLEEVEKEIAEVRKELENLHGTETEVYARIVGYYRAVKNWNKGKKDEYAHRKLFTLDGTEYDRPATALTLPSANDCESCSIKAQPVLQAESQIESQAESQESQESQVSQDHKEAYYELYTRQTCPNCPPVKNYMKDLTMKGKTINVDNEDGFNEAISKGVFATPTVIFYKDGKEQERCHNVEELEEFFESVTA